MSRGRLKVEEVRYQRQGPPPDFEGSVFPVFDNVKMIFDGKVHVKTKVGDNCPRNFPGLSLNAPGPLRPIVLKDRTKPFCAPSTVNEVRSDLKDERHLSQEKKEI